MLRTTAPVRHVATTSRPVHAGRQAVVVMAKKTNTEEYRRLTASEIDAKVLELQQDLFKLRIAQSTQQSFKSHEFVVKRKEVCVGSSRTFDRCRAQPPPQIARLLTVKREKEIVQGVTKRESRAANRRAYLAALNE